jgi:hypothetical protein
MPISLKHSLFAAGLALVPNSVPALDLVAPPPVPVPAPPVNAVASPRSGDDRLAKLKSYFRLQRVPVAHLAEEFLRVADQHGLDWRLLPTIAVIETGAGRHSQNNNIFGWGNGRLRFPSVQASIEMVARSMASMSCYRGKTLDGVLWTYNPVRGYSEKIFNAMKTLDPDFRKSASVMLPQNQLKPNRSSLR